MATVSFEGATRIYPKSDRRAVDRLELELADGEFVVLIGPSGCGKTTSLRMLAGLEHVDAGKIRINGDDITDLEPRDRDIAMVFQSYALYPHMNVADNMGFSLKVAKVAKSEISKRVREAAAILDLQDYLTRKPSQLSGGQRQRVAMGRAIVRQPQVFLMDEPLSNLDAKLRVATRGQIAALQKRLGITTLYVTHDQVEAMTMGDRVAVMRDGVMQQCDTARALYDSPANAFVAGFIGSPAMNLLNGTVTERGIQIERTVLEVPMGLRERANQSGRDVIVGLRPESLEIAAAGEGLPVIVDIIEQLGAEAFVHAKLRDKADRSLTAKSDLIARVAPSTALRLGELVHLRVKPGGLLLFDPKSEARI
jgi:multiple sugar transport system ATP-binding protein